MLSAGLCKTEGSRRRRQKAAKVSHCSPARKLDPTRAEDLVYVLYNRRCTFEVQGARAICLMVG